MAQPLKASPYRPREPSHTKGTGQLFEACILLSHQFGARLLHSITRSPVPLLAGTHRLVCPVFTPKVACKLHQGRGLPLIRLECVESRVDCARRVLARLLG